MSHMNYTPLALPNPNLPLHSAPPPAPTTPYLNLILAYGSFTLVRLLPMLVLAQHCFLPFGPSVTRMLHTSLALGNGDNHVDTVIRV